MSDDRSRCGVCEGACIAGDRSCLAHAGPRERAAALKQFSESGDLDVRGVTISDALLQEIFGAASQDADGRPKFSAIQFGGATFEGAAEFDGATFEGDAVFVAATFNFGGGFRQATFKRTAGFDAATFKATAVFNQSPGPSAGTAIS